MTVEKTTVPPFKVWETPQCPHCTTPFILHHGQGESYETWRQACACLPTGNESFMRVYIPEDGRDWMEEFFHGENIGKPIILLCVLCRKPMTEGEEALNGCMGKYSYCGYAHPPCYELMLEDMAKAQADAEAAEKGPSIAFWFSIADPLKSAPNTGHYDGEVRLVPEGLPSFPEGAVIYELYRRPFAMSYADFPHREDAERWWREATANDQAAWELHWYEPGKKQERAIRSWTGKGFAKVQSEARMAEWDAMRYQGR